MPTHSRSLSLRESHASQRTGKVEEDVAARNAPSIPHARATTTSLPTAAPPERVPSHRKSTSAKILTSGAVDADHDATVRSITARRSLLPPRGEHKAGIISGPIPSDAGTPTEGKARQRRDGRSPERRATLRPKSLVLPDESASSPQLRPKSGAVPQSSATDSATKSQHHEAPTTPSSSATRLQRSTSLRQPSTPRSKPTAAHSRHRSQVIGSEHKQAAGNPGTPSSSKSPIKSALQQQPSPRKPSIPVTPSTPAAHPSRDIVAGSGPPPPPEITSLQTELLQLRVLHSQALQARVDWESNNKKHFQELHASAVSAYRAVASAEKDRQRRINSNAIDHWHRDSKTSEVYNFPEQIQLLSCTVQDVADLTGAYGRYEAVLRLFERWFKHATQVRQSRAGQQRDSKSEARSESESESQMMFIDPLDSAWKEEVDSLRLKLAQCARNLDCLDVRTDEQADGTDYHASALARIVRGHKVILVSMLDELKIMPRIEKEVIQWEDMWVKNAVDRVCQPGEDEVHLNDSALDHNRTTDTNPVWTHI